VPFVVLNVGAILSLRDADRAQPPVEQTAEADGGRSVCQTPNNPAEAANPPTPARDRKTHPAMLAVLISLSVGLGVVVGVYEHHIILGVIVIALILTLCNQLAKLWTEQRDRRVGHP
jgi:hypothetical protein